MAVLDEGHRLSVPVGLWGLRLFATVDVVLGCATCKNGIEKNSVLKRDSNGTRDEPGAVVLMIVRKPLSPSTS